MGTIRRTSRSSSINPVSGKMSPLTTALNGLIIINLMQLTQTAVITLSHPDIAQQCPKEKPFCAPKAIQGECFGTSVKSTTLRRICPCACDLVGFDRIQTCCKTVGQHGMGFCLPLCKYNTTTDELGTGLGYKCVSQLTTWAYCASDANNNIGCCMNKGVPSDCLSFCRGDVPTCDLQSIFAYQPCLKHITTIIQCHVENLSGAPNWDPEWTARCDWDSST